MSTNADLTRLRRLALAIGCAVLLAWQSDAVLAKTPTRTTTQQEQRKLDLEINKLSHETSSWSRVREGLSAASLLLALVAVGFSAYQYFGDHRLASRIRLEEQFAGHLGTLSDYSRTGNLASARVVWALENIRELTRLAPNPDVYRRRVTEVLTTGVLTDAKFEAPEHVRLDSACLDRWPDYLRWLNEHPRDRSFLLYRYQQAARVLSNRHKDYFAGMDYGEQGYVVERYIDEPDYLLFTALSDGYSKHIASIPGDERAVAIDAFGEAMGNVALARKVFADRAT